MPGHQGAAIAHPNIALIKYWGNRDHVLRLPWHGSLSMNLDGAVTRTRVAFESDSTLTDSTQVDSTPAESTPTDATPLDSTPSDAQQSSGGDQRGDRVWINGSRVSGPALERVSRHLDLLRSRAGRGGAAVVVSENSFPMATGIASSASAFAALTVAAAAALELDLSESELSALARRGSGSAARSVPAGFVEWHPGDDASSHAVSIAPPEHWDLRDLVAVVSAEPKKVGSTSGHKAAEASSLFDCRKGVVPGVLDGVRSAVLARDIEALGALSEHEALSLHAVAMTGDPSLLYWAPATLELLHAIRAWRRGGLACFFTLDAGPNVHVICEGAAAARVIDGDQSQTD